MPKVLTHDNVKCPYCKSIQDVGRDFGYDMCPNCYCTYKITITSNGLLTLWKKSSAEIYAGKRKLYFERIIKLNQLQSNDEVKVIAYAKQIGLNRHQVMNWMNLNKFKINYRNLTIIWNEI